MGVHVMNAKHLISAGAVAMLTVSCAYSIKTATDYDRTVMFSNYHSYVIVKGNSSGNPLMDERARADVEKALALKGWTEVPDGQAQAAVVVHAATKTEHSYETFYNGWSGWHWRWGPNGLGDSATFIDNYNVGTLVVDIFDAKTKRAIWHGSASDALSDNARSNAKATGQAVNKMFSDFPPAPGDQ
jgi:uncharacterized protein DUF4136